MELKLEDREKLLDLREAVIESMDTQTICSRASLALNAPVEFVDIKNSVIAFAGEKTTENPGISKDITVNTNVVAKLNVYCEKKKIPDEYFNEYINVLVGVLSSYFSKTLFASAQHTAFDELLLNLISRKYNTEVAVRISAASAKINLPEQFFPIVIETQEPLDQEKNDTLIKQLSFVLKDALIGKYKKRYIAFIPAKGHKRYDNLFNYDELNSVLFHFNAYAGLCYRSSLAVSTFEFYNFGKALIDLGKALSTDSQNRIFRFSDYHEILMIHICNTLLEENKLSKSLVHLCSPSFLELYRRDLETGDNLASTINEYFSCNCNTTQTAEKLFIHRNTLINKINSAKKVLGNAFGNPSFQYVFRMSYNIMKYIETFKNGSIGDLNRHYGL